MSDAVDQIDATSACRTGAVKPTSFPPSVVITDAVGELHLWCWPMGPTWLENKDASSSGRLVLRDQRHRNICQPFCRINLILALAGLARKPVWSDITVTTSSGFLAASFSVSVEAPPTRDSQVPNSRCCQQSGRSSRRRIESPDSDPQSGWFWKDHQRWRSLPDL